MAYEECTSLDPQIWQWIGAAGPDANMPVVPEVESKQQRIKRLTDSIWAGAASGAMEVAISADDWTYAAVTPLDKYALASILDFLKTNAYTLGVLLSVAAADDSPTPLSPA